MATTGAVTVGEKGLREIRQAIAKLQLDLLSSPKNNLTATISPSGTLDDNVITGSTDDRSDGYAVGSYWLKTDGGVKTLFLCIDATTNNASWLDMTNAGLAASDHGSLSGLSDDDHSQYHNDSRGDARYYTETELDAGQLDGRYFTESEHLNSSAGAGDSGKPIKLDAGGHVDASMINDADIDHGGLGGLSDDDHTQYLLIDGSRAMTGDLTLGGNIQMGASLFRAFVSNAAPVLTIIGGPSDSYTHYITITNDVAGSPSLPTVGVAGTSDDINVNLVPKGAGRVSDNGVTIPTISSTDTLTNKTLTTPTIGDLTNAQHDHADAAGGGDLAASAIPARFKKRTAVFELNSPAADNEYLMIRTHQDTSFTITAVGGEVGDGTSATFQIEQHAVGEMKAGGTSVDVLTDPLAFTTSGASSSSFNDATVPASTWLKFKCTAVSGSPAIAWGWIEYTVDDS